jgi:hypothetical protein
MKRKRMYAARQFRRQRRIDRAMPVDAALATERL